MKPFFYSLSVALLCVSTATNATGPRVSASLFEPPVNEIFALDFPVVLSPDAPEGGVAAAIIKAAFEAENVQNTITQLPLQSMISHYLTEENALAVAGHDLNLTNAEAKNVITVPVVSLRESYFYFHPKHEKLSWTGKLSELKGLKIGVHKNDISDLYKKADINIVQERLEVRINALIAGEIDLVREADVAMNETLKTHFSQYQKEFVRLEPKAGDTVVTLAFNKKNPNGVTLAKQFQQGLAKITASGKLNEILKKYINEN